MAATASLAVTGVVALGTPARADTLSACTATTGARVAVDFGPWSGPLAVGCDAHLTSATHGIDLLTAGGFTTAGDQHDGPEFICRIASPLFPSPDATTADPAGTGYPTPAQDPCVVTPPATAYWSYWIAPAGQDTWSYSSLGAYSDQPADGEVEAWVYGGTDIDGTSGQPAFTPAQVRAQTTATSSPAPPATAAGPIWAGSGTAPSGRTAPAARAESATTPYAAATTPDLAAGVHYLVSATNANGVTGGTSLSADGYYDSFTDWADWGLTIDGALALAATGTDDTTLRKVVGVIDSASKDPSGNTINSWTAIGTSYAEGGSIGKEALLAEATGYDPHDFGGQNLISALDGLVCPAADSATGCAAPGDYAYATSTFSQALGIMAQLRADDSADAAAPIAYLEGLQEPSGAWPSLIPSTGDADVDSTAMAVMALALAPGDTASADVARGIAWIAAQQQSDGGFPGAAGVSTNSAGLAVQGLTLDKADYQPQITKALAFLAGQQNSDGGFNVAAGGQQGSDVRASTQVVGGAVGTSFGTLSDDVNTGTPPTSPPTTGGPTTSPTSPTSPTGSGTPTVPATPSTSAVPPAGGSGGTGGSGAVAVAAGGPSGPLADTGATHVLGLAAFGLALLLGGTALLVARRRRPAVPPRRH